jgi:primary-amine oxidase
MQRVLIDTWAYGGLLVPEQYRDRRVGWTDLWYYNEPGSNPYANPIAGLHFVVDMNSLELLEIEDSGTVEPPNTMGEYVPHLVPGQRLRDDVAPLEIVQPRGVSFTLTGNHLRWQRWSMRIGFNPREGLVIHTLGYQEGDRVRPVAHRLSFAEMVVPYRDPTEDHKARTAFDIGEWGLGFMTTSLELGCDCLGEIAYLDAVVHDSQGEPQTIRNAICIHEEDNAVLWKHVDPEAGTEVRRARRLVVSFHATVANYEYLVYWRFYQDGSIECEVRATGIMVTTRFDGEQPPYGTLVDERTYAPFHQHFLVARLDMDVDGVANTVIASESEAVPVGPENPHGLGIVQRETPLRTESEGRQDYDWATQRTWKIVNPNARNALGRPTGYKLVPGGALPPLMDAASPVMQRAQVIGHTLWVTPYAEEERWPCGEFVVQSAEDRGLPAWTAANRSIENTDVVLWYVFGIHHVTRPEEWPVMPVDIVSFWLKPTGFFARNPALDLPAH